MTAALRLPAPVQILCLHCGTVFYRDTVQWMPVYCSDECRARARREQARLRDVKRSASPKRILECRARNREWAAKNRNRTGRNPWLFGQPPCEPLLPCVSLDIAVSPAPYWPFQLRNMRGVHGALTALLANTLGIRHLPRLPTFAVRHDGKALRVLVWNREARRLDGASYEGVLWDRPTTFHIEDAVDVSSPRVPKRGHRKLRITTVTPIIFSKNGRKLHETRPTSTSLLNSISGEFLHRFDLQYLAADVRCNTLDIRTEPAHVNLGGKFRQVYGWQGEVVVDVNAIGHWLLLAAEKVGLGSRTSFGFGQIHVEEM